MMIRDMFVGAKKPKMPKYIPPPTATGAPVQTAMKEEEQRRARAKSSTVLTAQTGYGNVGNI